MEYEFDDLGNLSWRRDNLTSQKEIFSYDDLNRLTKIEYEDNGTPQPSWDFAISYDRGGNIESKTDAGGIMEYGNDAGPHALTAVKNPHEDYVRKDQIISYTAFNKVESIQQEDDNQNLMELAVSYGLDNQRIKSVFKRGTSTERTKYFIGEYEEEITASGTKKIHYIGGANGLSGIFISDDQGNDTLYYTLQDHLGSLTGMINSVTDSVDYFSYDAWGNARQYDDWTTKISSDPFADRGFTGHEHLTEFGLIDMNGRVYDPIVGRFLSPDPYVQFPGYANSFNRYAYCLNNPLVYTDPSGEFFLGTIFTFAGNLVYTLFADGGLSFNKNIRSDAWRDFDPSASWSATNKAWKIDIGGFKTDPNRTIVGRGLQLLSRWTWELPQTVLGKAASHSRNCLGQVDNVDYYGGATLVNDYDPSYRGAWGFTLGPYINSKNIVADPNVSEIFRHEYGHTLQSRLVGPLYLTHVALPSLVGSGLEDLGLNDHNREWYETQANRMAFRYFSNHDSGPLTTLPWDDNDYPREYNPNWYWLFAHPPLLLIWWLFF